MPTLKNQLISTIPLKTNAIAQLLKNTEDTYRKDKAPKLYDCILRYPRKGIGSEKFIELVYETLEAFNMNAQGAKLSKYSVFEKSIKKHIDTIQSLSSLKLENVKEADNKLNDSIIFLFDNLHLVETKSSLVTFSKTMHFFLPDLFVPIDRKYTLQFFYGKQPYKRVNYGLYYLTKTPEKEKDCLFQVLEQSRHFAHEHRELLKKHVNSNSRWNRNIPKIIDNLIIAYP